MEPGFSENSPELMIPVDIFFEKEGAYIYMQSQESIDFRDIQQQRAAIQAQAYLELVDQHLARVVLDPAIVLSKYSKMGRHLEDIILREIPVEGSENVLAALFKVRRGALVTKASYNSEEVERFKQAMAEANSAQVDQELIRQSQSLYLGSPPLMRLEGLGIYLGPFDSVRFHKKQSFKIKAVNFTARSEKGVMDAYGDQDNYKSWGNLLQLSFPSEDLFDVDYFKAVQRLIERITDLEGRDWLNTLMTQHDGGLDSLYDELHDAGELAAESGAIAEVVLISSLMCKKLL